MAYATNDDAVADAIARVATGEFLQAMAVEHAGAPAIYALSPLSTAGNKADGMTSGGGWNWYTE